MSASWDDSGRQGVQLGSGLPVEVVFGLVMLVPLLLVPGYGQGERVDGFEPAHEDGEGSQGDFSAPVLRDRVTGAVLLAQGGFQLLRVAVSVEEV